MAIPPTFGQRVKARRIELNLTQEQLADAVGCRQAAVSDWENDKAIPTIAMASALARALKVGLVELVEGKRERRAAS